MVEPERAGQTIEALEGFSMSRFDLDQLTIELRRAFVISAKLLFEASETKERLHPRRLVFDVLEAVLVK
ncbi:MAG TPA: hypothetical protein VK116_19455 [Planctomycetota bacterium]|nr:hypothetical protein [Planctomycetota bacterium]